MFVVDTNAPHKGIRYREPEYNSFNCSVPIAMPRHAEVLDITTGLCCAEKVNLLFQASHIAEQIQGPSTKRHCKVLGDDVATQKYVGCFGQPFIHWCIQVFSHQ
jgi:hypothetical protein